MTQFLSKEKLFREIALKHLGLHRRLVQGCLETTHK